MFSSKPTVWSSQKRLGFSHEKSDHGFVSVHQVAFRIKISKVNLVGNNILVCMMEVGDEKVEVKWLARRFITPRICPQFFAAKKRNIHLWTR
jgi:hypothetical protein